MLKKEQEWQSKKMPLSVVGRKKPESKHFTEMQI
jgi:hypothetical protein